MSDDFDFGDGIGLHSTHAGGAPTPDEPKTIDLMKALTDSLMSESVAAEAVADRIIQSVCELDPADYPEDDRDTLKTSDRDLRMIVERHVCAALLAARGREEAMRGIINELQLAMFEDEEECTVILRHSRDVFKRARADAAAIAATQEPGK